MSNTPPLPKEITDRINKDSDAWVNPRVIYAGYMQSSYIEGATAEATRALPLIEALENIQKVCQDKGPKMIATDNELHVALYHCLHFAKESLKQYNKQP
jgi:hypothetical protein